MWNDWIFSRRNLTLINLICRGAFFSLSYGCSLQMKWLKVLTKQYWFSWFILFIYLLVFAVIIYPPSLFYCWYLLIQTEAWKISWLGPCWAEPQLAWARHRPSMAGPPLSCHHGPIFMPGMDLEDWKIWVGSISLSGSVLTWSSYQAITFILASQISMEYIKKKKVQSIRRPSPFVWVQTPWIRGNSGASCV